MKLFKSLFPILLFSLLFTTFYGTAFSGDKLVTTMSGRSYYDIYDTDAMTEDSATGIPTQQSVKAYVDNEITGRTKLITVQLLDISSSGSTYFAMPITGTITRSTGVLGSPITGASSILNLSAYGSAMGNMTVYTSSSAGEVDYFVPTAITVAKDTAVRLQSYGSSTGTATEYVTFEITPN